MKAKVKIAFSGVADGEVYPRTFAPGDIIEGDLATAEVMAGRATKTTGTDDDQGGEEKAKKPVKNKAKKPPRNKAG